MRESILFFKSAHVHTLQLYLCLFRIIISQNEADYTVRNKKGNIFLYQRSRRKRDKTGLERRKDADRCHIDNKPSVHNKTVRFHANV